MSPQTEVSRTGSQPFWWHLNKVAEDGGASRAWGRSPARTPLRSALRGLRQMWEWGARWLPETSLRRNTARRLVVTETVSLGEKRFLSIVRVDDAQFLIGSSASSVQLLAQLEAAPEEAAPAMVTRRRSA